MQTSPGPELRPPIADQDSRSPNRGQDVRPATSGKDLRATTPGQDVRPPIGAIAVDILLNATFPVIFYELSKRFVSPSEMTALILATTFPVAKSIFGLVRRAQLDPISILVLVAIAIDAIAIFFGGSPRLLLLRESMFSGAVGVACFVSLLLPRPMMFYFGRYFTGTDPKRLAGYDAAWQFPHVRFAHRLITTVWGVVFVTELILRIILIYKIPAAAVLVLSPILLGSLTVATMIWTFRYATSVRRRAVVLLSQASAT